MSESTVRLTVALAQRMTAQNFMSFLLVPIGLAAVAVAFVLTARYFPEILTGPTRSSLEQIASQSGIPVGATDTARASAALFLQAPYLLTFLSSMYVVSLLSSSLIAETHKGGIEMLLAEPYSPGQIVAAFFWNAVVISLIVWFVMGFLFIVVAFVLVSTLGLKAPAPSFIGLTLMLPFAGMLWSAQIVFIVHLLFPKMNSVQIGTGRALLNYITSSPAIVVFVVITFFPTLGATTVAFTFLALGLAGAIVVSSLLPRIFRPSVLLENN